MLKISKAYLITNPVEIYKGLAFEQALYFSVMKDSLDAPILCLWRSTSSVVVGRNQNLFIEANIPFLNRHEIDLARRDSGGGTVFHDEHNVNICIVKKNSVDIMENLLLVCEVLKTLDFECEIDDKHNILYDGKKISGSAFRYSSNTHLHHFTLLLNTNLEWLRQSLHTSHGLRIETVGIPSNRMEVTNLDIDTERVIHAFETSGFFNAIEQIKDIEKPFSSIFFEEYNRLKSGYWIYDRCPNFNIILAIKNRSYRLRIDRGMLKSIEDEDTKVNIFKEEIRFYDFVNLQRDISCSIIKEVQNQLRKKLFGGIL